jgi:hypothetical protein
LRKWGLPLLDITIGPALHLQRFIILVGHLAVQALFRLNQIVDVPYAEFGKRKKVLARHKHPHIFVFSSEMQQAKGGVVWVAKEFKSRQELCFDLHFDLLSHADRCPLII